MRTPPANGPAVRLVGHSAECGSLDRLVEDVRAGESRALVLHGEAGSGKTALLEYTAERASGCCVARVSGVQSEMELAFAGLHQLCAPMLDHLEGLPPPQRDVLRSAFGMRTGPPPDLSLVGLAVLALLSDVAAERPLLCLVDDQQWLDDASVQALSLAGRRLGAESIGMVFATRDLGDHLAGLPDLAIGGLRAEDARALLESVMSGPLDARIRDQIIAETRGNPLALLELSRWLTGERLAGGFGLPGAAPLPGGAEPIFRERIGTLPEASRRLLLLAAADPTGDAALVWRAAGRLDIAAGAAVPVTEAELAEFGTRVRFRHPLVRTVAYRSAAPGERQAVHRALAEATDPLRGPERRAWHRAQAAPGPDEEVAGELERSAGRARARGGLAAAAAFLERAAALTPDPPRRARRALAAALAKFQVGAFDAAHNLVAVAEAGPLDELQHARADLLRARLAFMASRGDDAPPLLMKAAERLGPVDAALSRATYLEALNAAMFAGRLARPGGDAPHVARAALALPRPASPSASDLLLDGFATYFTEGFAAGLPILRRALDAFDAAMSADEELRCLWLGCVAALQVWDDDRWDALSGRYVRLAREAGALSELPRALSMRAQLLLSTGDLAAAASLVDEVQAHAEATAGNLTPYGAVGLAARRGHKARTRALVEAATRESAVRGEGIGIAAAELAAAILDNGLGHYSEAMASARRAAAHPRDLGIANWAAVELIEAAVRSGDGAAAADAYHRLAGTTGASGTAWALGVEARSGALLTDGADAERRYAEAITCLGRTRMRSELARAHLLYGEWLRRRRRRVEAREQLRTAGNMLEAMGLDAFAERARRELLATGETARKRTVPATGELTAQEAQIARLARDGLSNPEIASRLFISARTVQYHLGRVFTKLGITSRTQLDRALR
ncbi:AAA family ATPase [Actinomadura sp. GTD37]|uniref:helix-turn-helix transcriptional regulator n=1 Tax=Actinomadura sp. GTD37 TaxID=1778030 RepID=UPI0035C26B98